MDNSQKQNNDGQKTRWKMLLLITKGMQNQKAEDNFFFTHKFYQIHTFN